MCLFLLGSAVQSHAQHPALSTYDDFYLEPLGPDSRISNYFLPKAMVSTVVYDSTGAPTNVVFTPSEYQKELTRANEAFEIRRTPLVLLFREYSDMVSVYASIHLELRDRTSGEIYSTESIQSIKLVKKFDDWFITNLSIQNEIPSDPIPAYLKPQMLIDRVEATEKTDPISETPDIEMVYDPNKVYKVNEVDEAPTYPGDGQTYISLLEQFDVVEIAQPGYTPFLIRINEDGLAELAYVHDLSGYQISRAESFVRSMMIWYPAIKDAASVKCKLLYYIHE